MNALFFTQSSTLKVYYDILQAMRQKASIEKVGFYISDSGYYQRFLAKHNEFEAGEFTLLKQWVVTQQAQKHALDIEKLKEYQDKLNVPNFWDALVSDRRIVNGPKYSFRQDYTPRFTHEEMLRILLENLIRIEKLFDEIQPDFTSCFICTTVAEYLCYLFSKARNIPFLNLRPTRMHNYVVYGQSIFEPSEFVAQSYKDYQGSQKEDEWQEKAREFVAFSREKHAKYEGVFLTTQKPPQVGSPLRIFKRISSSLLTRLREIAHAEMAYRSGPKYDRPLPGMLTPLLYWNLLNPLLVIRINSALSGKYVTTKELNDLDYIFFPLHKEPEVTLLVYSKPYLNQIEVVRNVAYSLPVDKLLLVKEHPASVGTRPLKYYQKLLEIPNVRLVDPRVEPRELIKQADMVVNIAGSVGFEALLLQKPVIIFGKTPYEMLPESMVRKVTNLDKLGETIVDLLLNYRHDETALCHYIAATMKESVPVEFYTKLLGRSGQFSTDADTDRQQHVARLAAYTLKMAAKARSSLAKNSKRVKVADDIATGNRHHGRNGHKREIVKD